MMLLFVCGALNAQAQNYNLKIKLVDKSNGEPVGYATVAETPEGKTDVLKYTQSDGEGSAAPLREFAEARGKAVALQEDEFGFPGGGDARREVVAEEEVAERAVYAEARALRSVLSSSGCWRHLRRWRAA